MTKSISLAVFCLGVFAPLAGAYEYPLQFTPNAGYRGLVVAGYHFINVVVNNVTETGVSGNCSYYTVSGGSSKGGSGKVTNYYQTCTWDNHGNLLSHTRLSAPVVAPHPLYTNGTETVYDQNAAGDVTGTDTKLAGRGFVNTPGGHYTWLTPNNNAVIHQAVYNISVTLKSDGDIPVDITAVTPSALHGTVTLKSSTCQGSIPVGGTCSITVTYDPTHLTGILGLLAFDTLRVDLTSDAAASHDFIQNYTVILPNLN